MEKKLKRGDRWTTGHRNIMIYARCAGDLAYKENKNGVVTVRANDAAAEWKKQ